MANTTRPFRILGIQQVAVGHSDKATLEHLWIDLLGLDKHGEYRSEKENVDETITKCGDVEVDLMQPLDSTRKPRVDIPALNHVGLWVDDLPKAVEWLSENGVRFTPGGIRPGAAGHPVCFIHPKGNDDHPVGGSGVLIELVQHPEGKKR